MMLGATMEASTLIYSVAALLFFCGFSQQLGAVASCFSHNWTRLAASASLGVVVEINGKLKTDSSLASWRSDFSELKSERSHTRL